MRVALSCPRAVVRQEAPSQKRRTLDACSYRTRREDRVSHAMDNLFVGGANRGEDTAKVGAGRFGFADDEVVGAKANAAFHWDQLIALEIKPLRLG